ncbi:MAG TPA: helix-hairpin-helix domain-containing protein [Kofleriaceae bacterium]
MRKLSLALEAALRSEAARHEALDPGTVHVNDPPTSIDAAGIIHRPADETPLTPSVKRRRPFKSPQPDWSEAPPCDRAQITAESEVLRDPSIALELSLGSAALDLADTERFACVLAAPAGGDGDDEDEDIPFDVEIDAEDELAIEELGDGGPDDVVHRGHLAIDLRASGAVSRPDATRLQRTTEIFSRAIRRVMVPLIAITLLVIAMDGTWSFAGTSPRDLAALANAGSGAGSGIHTALGATPSAVAARTAPTLKVGHRELSGKININTATEDELQVLPTVGPSKAERIVTWRKKNGGFKRTADLRRVKGFGYKTFKKLEPFLDIKGDTTLAAK